MTCRSAQLLTVQELVAAGHGVSLIPAMACALDCDRRRHYKRLSGRRPTRTLAMIWHRQRYQRPIVKAFIELLGESVRRRAADHGANATGR
jgi:LysR family hydrogen peroxide-inducible transcriptional activator